MKSLFSPSCWLPGPHWETIWASKFRSFHPPETKKEQIKLDDSDLTPLHRFVITNHYYSESSCRQHLNKISVPTLIMNSLDNHFLDTKTFPSPKGVSVMVGLEYLQKGGHAGFIIGNSWKNYRWIETQIPEFF